jgi:hypothetical protein
MLVPALERSDASNAAVADISQSYAAVAQSPDMSGMLTNKDIALTEAYARATTLQAELDRNDAMLRLRQVDLEAARAELAAANASRHELEMRLIRAREDVASELAVLASTMIKMKDDALLRADARIATLTSEIESLRSARHQPALTQPVVPALSATGARKVVPQVTAAGWEPGPYFEDEAGAMPEDDSSSTLPEMAKAVKAVAEESAPQTENMAADFADADSDAVDAWDAGDAAEDVVSNQMPGLDPSAASNSSAGDDIVDNTDENQA